MQRYDSYQYYYSVVLTAVMHSINRQCCSGPLWRIEFWPSSSLSWWCPCAILLWHTAVYFVLNYCCTSIRRCIIFILVSIVELYFYEYSRILFGYHEPCLTWFSTPACLYGQSRFQHLYGKFVPSPGYRTQQECKNQFRCSAYFLGRALRGKDFQHGYIKMSSRRRGRRPAK